MPRMRESARKPLQGAPFLATRPPAAQARGGLRGHQKRPKIGSAGGAPVRGINLRADPVPISSPAAGVSCSGAAGPRIRHLARLVESDELDALLSCRWPIDGYLCAAGLAAAINLQSVYSLPCGFGSTASLDGSTMTDEKDRRAGPLAGNPKPDSRQDRLRLALRENLKRRKSQARGRREPEPASSHRDEAAPHDDSRSKPDG
jgi:hypothetical protein